MAEAIIERIEIPPDVAAASGVMLPRIGAIGARRAGAGIDASDERSRHWQIPRGWLSKGPCASYSPPEYQADQPKGRNCGLALRTRAMRCSTLAPTATKKTSIKLGALMAEALAGCHAERGITSAAPDAGSDRRQPQSRRALRPGRRAFVHFAC